MSTTSPDQKKFDDVLRRMLKTPPTQHKADSKAGMRKKAKPKKSPR